MNPHQWGIVIRFMLVVIKHFSMSAPFLEGCLEQELVAAEGLDKKEVGMGDTKHTPGPWVVHPHGLIVAGKSRVFLGRHVQSLPSANLEDIVIDPKEREANLRLIAAAPELLEALKLITSKFITLIGQLAHGTIDPDLATRAHDFSETVRAAMVAIEKAEGPR